MEDFYNNINTEQNWEQAYREPDPLIYRALRDLRKNYMLTDMKEEQLQFIIDYLELATPLVCQSIDEYRYNNFSLNNFFTRSRLFSIFSELEPELTFLFLDYLYINKEPKLGVNKEKVKLIWNTFVEVVKRVIQTIEWKLKETLYLEALGLPTDTEKLQNLLDSATEFHSLFDWKKTSQGFYFWAKLFLEEKEDVFKYKVVSFFKYLDPNLIVKVALPLRMNSLRTATLSFKEAAKVVEPLGEGW